MWEVSEQIKSPERQKVGPALVFLHFHNNILLLVDKILYGTLGASKRPLGENASAELLKV